jgi:hypothetical protein
LAEFKSGRSPIMLATDVASRGLGKYLFPLFSPFPSSFPFLPCDALALIAASSLFGTVGSHGRTSFASVLDASRVVSYVLQILGSASCGCLATASRPRDRLHLASEDHRSVLFSRSKSNCCLCNPVLLFGLALSSSIIVVYPNIRPGMSSCALLRVHTTYMYVSGISHYVATRILLHLMHVRVRPYQAQPAPASSIPLLHTCRRRMR